MVLAAPATGAPALVAAAEARAGHAATRLVAAKDLLVTPLAIHAPAPDPALALAPRFTLSKATACLGAREEILKLL